MLHNTALNKLAGASRVTTLRYQGFAIRTMRCPQGIAWFALADVIRPLAKGNTSTIRKRIKDSRMVAMMNVWVPSRVNPEDSGYRDVQALALPGLTALLGVSKQQSSIDLLAWLTTEANPKEPV